MDSSQFSANQSHFESIEWVESQGATCDTFRVKVFGKLHLNMLVTSVIRRLFARSLRRAIVWNIPT